MGSHKMTFDMLLTPSSAIAVSRPTADGECVPVFSGLQAVALARIKYSCTEMNGEPLDGERARLFNSSKPH